MVKGTPALLWRVHADIEAVLSACCDASALTHSASGLLHRTTVKALIFDEPLHESAVTRHIGNGGKRY